MSDILLSLGAIEFREFEIPDSIRAGGAQALYKHKYAGGLRTIDTMGADDADIQWSGIFLAGTAQDRCKQLDIVRRQGKPIVLNWAGFQYLVVIANFEWDFKRTWHIPYSITLAVVQDQTEPDQISTEDIDSQIELDAADALDDADQVVQSIDEVVIASTDGPSRADLASMKSRAATLSSSVSGISTKISSVSAISTATVDFQRSLGAQVSAAAGISQSLQTQLDSAVTLAGRPSLYASGSSPPAMASALTNLSAFSKAIASTVNCTNVLGRMAKNIGAMGK